MSNLHLGGGVLYNKNVKAFTLIELLAVIVILAIIALIATPIILGVINDSKEKAFKLSLNNVFHAGEIYQAQHSIKPGTIVDIKDLPLDSKNLTGKIVINAEEEVEIKQITNGTYSAAGKKDHINIIKGSIEDLLENILTITVNPQGATRNSITVAVEADGVPISYSYIIKGQDNKQIGDTITSNEPSYTFTGLEPNKEYIIEVTATNRAGLNGYDKITLSTSEVTLPSLTLIPTYEEDNGKDYIRAGKVTIEYEFIEEGLINAYKWDDEEDFTPVTEDTIEIEAKNGNLIAVILDGEETVVSKVLEIDKIDTEGPTISVTSVAHATTGKTITITASDNKKLDSKAYSFDGGVTWQESPIKTEALDTTEPSTPVLGNLKPVVYNGTNWVVVDENSDWYDYSNQEWANAVLLRSGVTKNAGQTVTVEGSNPEAVAMFVWIPRYEYKIEGTYGTHSNTYNVVVKDEAGNTSSATYDGVGTKALPGEIEVKFIEKTKITADTGYILHPAFTFGTQELDGIWVGKFETSHTSLSSSTTLNNLECTTTSCTNASGLRILPSVTALEYNNVSNFFYAARSMQSKLGITGFDSHMSKNSEWGAAAYLSQSKYGKYGNTSYTGAAKEVAQNTNSSRLTGGGNYTSNTAQSTTGNITGIYDMSGGRNEYLMGVYRGSDASSIWGARTSSNEAGFTSAPASKYFDNYTTTDMTTACNNGICYGHDLSETSGWYGRYVGFVSSNFPWILCYGIFQNSYFTGAGDGSAASFRVVLTQS